MNHGHHDKLLIAYVDLEPKIVTWDALVASLHAPKDVSGEHVGGWKLSGAASRPAHRRLRAVRTGSVPCHDFGL